MLESVKYLVRYIIIARGLIKVFHSRDRSQISSTVNLNLSKFNELAISSVVISFLIYDHPSLFTDFECLSILA